MPEYYLLRDAAVRRRKNTGGIRLPFVLAALAVLMQGCATQQTQVVQSPDPSDPKAPVPATGYRSVIDNYESRRPVAPVPWRERNESVAPRSTRGGQ